MLKEYCRTQIKEFEQEYKAVSAKKFTEAYSQKLALNLSAEELYTHVMMDLREEIFKEKSGVNFYNLHLALLVKTQFECESHQSSKYINKDVLYLPNSRNV